jgi:hypothetical protein
LNPLGSTGFAPFFSSSCCPVAMLPFISCRRYFFTFVTFFHPWSFAFPFLLSTPLL